MANPLPFTAPVLHTPCLPDVISCDSSASPPSPRRRVRGMQAMQRRRPSEPSHGHTHTDTRTLRHNKVTVSNCSLWYLTERLQTMVRRRAALVDVGSTYRILMTYLPY